MNRYGETACRAGASPEDECVASAYAKRPNVIVVIVAIVAASVRIESGTTSQT